MGWLLDGRTALPAAAACFGAGPYCGRGLNYDLRPSVTDRLTNQTLKLA